MNDDKRNDTQFTSSYGAETPPPVLPPEEETAYEVPQHDGPQHDGPRYDGPQHASAAPGRHRPPSYVRWIGGCLITLVVIVLLCGGGTAVLAALTLNSVPATATVDKSFSVSGVPTLNVRYNAFSVHVKAGGDGQITLHATKRVRALTHDQAQRDLDAINITATQTGNEVTVQVENDAMFRLNLFSDREIDLTLTAPANTNLIVEGNAGSLDATGLTGKITARVNAGSVTMDNMTVADGSSIRTNAGSFTMDGALQSGASLTVDVNAGSVDLTMPKDTSAHLNASASAGSVDVNGWNVDRVQEASHVTVIGDLNPNPTGSIVIRVSAGSARLNAA